MLLSVSMHTPLAVSELSSSSEYGEHGGPEGNGPTSLTGGEGDGSAGHTQASQRNVHKHKSYGLFPTITI